MEAGWIKVTYWNERPSKSPGTTVWIQAPPQAGLLLPDDPIVSEDTSVEGWSERADIPTVSEHTIEEQYEETDALDNLLTDVLSQESSPAKTNNCSISSKSVKSYRKTLEETVKELTKVNEKMILNEQLKQLQRDRSSKNSITQCSDNSGEVVCKMYTDLNGKENVKPLDKPYPCEFCPKHFKTKGSLGAHALFIHGQKVTPHTCKLCPLRFRWGYELAAHIKAEHLQQKHMQQKFSCNVCAKKYKRQSLLTRHILKAHCVDNDLTPPEVIALSAGKSYDESSSMVTVSDGDDISDGGKERHCLVQLPC